MSASLLKAYHTGYLRRAKLSLEEACREANLETWAVRTVGQQHAHLGPTRVDQLPTLLLQADLDIKGSSTLKPHVVLEKLLTTLAKPRED